MERESSCQSDLQNLTSNVVFNLKLDVERSDNLDLDQSSNFGLESLVQYFVAVHYMGSSSGEIVLLCTTRSQQGTSIAWLSANDVEDSLGPGVRGISHET